MGRLKGKLLGGEAGEAGRSAKKGEGMKKGKCLSRRGRGFGGGGR